MAGHEHLTQMGGQQLEHFPSHRFRIETRPTEDYSDQLERALAGADRTTGTEIRPLLSPQMLQLGRQYLAATETIANLQVFSQDTLSIEQAVQLGQAIGIKGVVEYVFQQTGQEALLEYYTFRQKNQR